MPIQERVGNRGDDLPHEIRTQTRREARVRLADRPRDRQQHMIPDDREARSGARGNRLEIVAPAMLGVDRGSMVDQPELAMPEQQVRIARGAIDIGEERIEPDDVRGKLR